MQENEIWPYYQMAHPRPRRFSAIFRYKQITEFRFECQSLWWLWSLTTTTKRIRRIVNFIVLANHRVKIKENEISVKYLDLARETKIGVKHESNGYTYCNWRTWNGPLGIKGRIETIPTTALRSARILRRLLETWLVWFGLLGFMAYQPL